MLSVDLSEKYHIPLQGLANENLLLRGSWIVLVNATRIPPHIGMIFNGKYFSLNINGQELDVNIFALLRRIELQKIKSVFVELKPHPVFSLDYLQQHFQQSILKHPKVSGSEATCFTPVKEYFSENYALPAQKMEYLYQLFPLLYEQEVINSSFALHLTAEDLLPEMVFPLPVYNKKNIEDKLKSLPKRS